MLRTAARFGIDRQFSRKFLPMSAQLGSLAPGNISRISTPRAPLPVSSMMLELAPNRPPISTFSLCTASSVVRLAYSGTFFCISLAAAS